MYFVRCDECGTRRDHAAAVAEGWREVGDDRWRCPAHGGVRDEPRGFDEPEDGAQARFEARRAARPWIAHRLWWLVHNAVSHPLIGLVPRRPLFRFHDWTSRKMHGL